MCLYIYTQCTLTTLVDETVNDQKGIMCMTVTSSYASTCTVHVHVGLTYYYPPLVPLPIKLLINELKKAQSHLPPSLRKPLPLIPTFKPEEVPERYVIHTHMHIYTYMYYVSTFVQHNYDFITCNMYSCTYSYTFPVIALHVKLP